MNAYELLEYLVNLSEDKAGQTVDTIKAGDAGRQVKKAAVCFIATPNVIKAAHDWGADLLITHEPTYHDHYDNFDGSEIETEKRNLIESTGMTVLRFHDHAHSAVPDMIHRGFLESLGLRNRYYENRFCTLENPVTPLELAELIERKIGIRHVRIVGKRDFKATRLAFFLGACGAVNHLPLKEGKAEIAVCGETCEWKCCEFVRDAAELGHDMAMLVIGHEGGEREGMKLIAQKIKDDIGIDTKYIESEEVYTYTE